MSRQLADLASNSPRAGDFIKGRSRPRDQTIALRAARSRLRPRMREAEARHRPAHPLRPSLWGDSSRSTTGSISPPAKDCASRCWRRDHRRVEFVRAEAQASRFCFFAHPSFTGGRGFRRRSTQALWLFGADAVISRRSGAFRLSQAPAAPSDACREPLGELSPPRRSRGGLTLRRVAELSTFTARTPCC